ncbi:site-specific integrase [Paenibacillus melissococcoides]|uniref:Site-specific integrase n=1 Tax=Paenibacillus melissococcoides TaxID=2912268 RepID=A0ABM9G8G0_9BACL|nr:MULTISPECIES: tyrosine-type recombinase/integrase [Paenibacillus]MEB9893767.1 tyrosine-type recombinase/integrase [Bacillus cereus]CAH8248051.1 site-specific integrase [Paenibacillus melissococcoides]CAH8718761.1 site-specific integrase [Paenibacillus melissococcoides]CAH8719765.1 site-specific integrase [Paenibacillus melissococcoides]GIO79538.1 site-specific integrase [Paenibacillus dendritiformis]
MTKEKKPKKKQEKKKKLPPGVRERDGRYTFRYSVPVVLNGKKTRKQKETPSFSTAEEAESAGILIKADQIRGKLVDEKEITLEKWFERWLENYIIENDPRDYTIRNKKTVISSLKKHLGKDTRVKDTTGDDYQQWLNGLKKKGREEGTLKEYHSNACMIFGDAVRKKIITNDPTEGAKVPAYKQTLEEIEAGETDLPKYLEKEQLKHLLNIARFRGLTQDYNLFVALAYTGLRIGELLALKVGDFNESDHYVSVTKTLTDIGGVKKYKLGPPKNKSSIRKVSIGATVTKVIKAQLDWQEQKKKDGEILHDAGFIFWSPRFPGYPNSKSMVEYRFNRLLKIAGLPTSLTPHSLRHTHVTLLAEAGEDLAVIQDRLGHKNDKITRQVYLHVTQTRKELVPDKFERVMNS